MADEKLVLREEVISYSKGIFIISRESDNALRDDCENLPTFEYSAKEIGDYGGVNYEISVSLLSPKKEGDGRKMESYEGVLLKTRNEARDYAYDIARVQAETIAKLSGLTLEDRVKGKGNVEAKNEEEKKEPINAEDITKVYETDAYDVEIRQRTVNEKRKAVKKVIDIFKEMGGMGEMLNRGQNKEQTNEQEEVDELVDGNKKLTEDVRRTFRKRKV